MTLACPLSHVGVLSGCFLSSDFHCQDASVSGPDFACLHSQQQGLHLPSKAYLKHQSNVLPGDELFLVLKRPSFFNLYPIPLLSYKQT